MHSKAYKRIISALGMAIVISVIVLTFVFRKQIENYAVTGYAGLLIACFAATSTILLPAPGIIVVIQYAQILNPVIVVLLGGLGTALGEMLGYLFGRFGQAILEIDPNSKALNWFKRKTYLTVFVFSILPLPVFDIVGIAAGANKTNPILFWMCCFVGKTLKMAIYVLLFSYVKTYLPKII